jgi:hypothetical protein
LKKGETVAPERNLIIKVTQVSNNTIWDLKISIV